MFLLLFKKREREWERPNSKHDERIQKQNNKNISNTNKLFFFYYCYCLKNKADEILLPSSISSAIELLSQHINFLYIISFSLLTILRKAKWETLNFIIQWRFHFLIFKFPLYFSLSPSFLINIFLFFQKTISFLVFVIVD